jgi:hypothetical protein
VAGLVQQPHLEDWGISGYSGSRRGLNPDAALDDAFFARSYTVWRNPQDRSDPVNLAPLAPQLQESLAREVPADLPGWLLRSRERMRYPALWEAVHTHWFGPSSDAEQEVDALLQAHVEHILRNRYRDELGLGSALSDAEPAKLIPRSAVHPTEVIVDDVPVPGVVVDSDPFVYGVGAVLPDARRITAVIPRDMLDLLEVRFRSNAD